MVARTLLIVSAFVAAVTAQGTVTVPTEEPPTLIATPTRTPSTHGPIHSGSGSNYGDLLVGEDISPLIAPRPVDTGATGLITTLSGIGSGSTVGTEGEMCEEQHGFDFDDHDFKQVKGPVKSCCDACMNTDGCNAWSWNQWNNGTCYLKKGVGKIVANPGVISARVFPTIPLDACRVADNFDYEDANIGSVKASKVEDCCQICRNYQGCRYYSWNNYQDGTCWLKATGEKKVAKLNVWSAQAYSTGGLAPSPEPTQPLGQMCEDQNGFDFVGHDIKHVNGSVDTCCGQCMQTSGCKAWTWSGWNDGTCFLKDGVDKIVENPSVRSSRVFFVIPLDGCHAIENADYEDANIAQVKAPKVEDCCNICRKHQGCRYYSWNSYQDGTCWLKATGDKKVTKLGVWAAPAYSTHGLTA